MRTITPIIIVFLLGLTFTCFSQDERNLQEKLDSYTILKSAKSDLETIGLLRDCYYDIEENFENKSYKIETLTKYVSIFENYLSVYPFNKEKYKESTYMEPVYLVVTVGRLLFLAKIYDFRAAMKFKKSDFNGAFDDFKKSVDIYNDNEKLHNSKDIAVRYYNMALCKFELNERNDACKYLSKSGELGFDMAYEMIKMYCNE